LHFIVVIIFFFNKIKNLRISLLKNSNIKL